MPGTHIPSGRHARLPTAVHGLDLRRIRWKLKSKDPTKWTDDVLDLAEREYRRFLALKVLYPGREFVPTELTDEFWHQHILDTAAYARDCDRIFGRFIHHYPYFGMHGAQDAADLAAEFDRTSETYRQVFGELPPGIDTARCKDHACHVPSECACRSPGACK